MNPLPLIVLTAVALVGAALGVLVALRGERAGAVHAPPRDEQEQGLLRVTGEIHTGWEQTLIGLIRELQLPREASDVAYGALYLESRSEHRLYVRTRSEIGRGFLGVIDIRPRRGPTEITYAIVRLPGDDGLHARVLDFELDLIAAMRRIDGNANVHLAAEALREFDRPRQVG
jgi:hypothetical protein